MFRAIGTFSPTPISAIAPPNKHTKDKENCTMNGTSHLIEDLLPTQFSTMLSFSTDSAIWGSDFGDLGSTFAFNNNNINNSQRLIHTSTSDKRGEREKIPGVRNFFKIIFLFEFKIVICKVEYLISGFF